MGVAITSLAACGGSSTKTVTDTNQKPTAVITVGDTDYSHGDSISVAQGESLTLSAKNSSDPEDGDKLTYFWNKDEAELVKDLVFSELGINNVSLYVKDTQGKPSDPIVLRIDVKSTTPDDEVVSITIVGDTAFNFEVEENKSINLSAVVDYKTAADGTTVTWTVEAGTGTAEINAAGQLKGKTAGSVTVFAEQGGVKQPKEITVTPSDVEKAAVDVVITGDKAVAVNDEISLNAAVSYNTGQPDNSVTWTIENGDGEAEFSSPGILKGLKAGSVTVTATSVLNTNILDTYEVKVAPEGENAAKSVVIAGDKKVELNKDITLIATVAYTLEDDDAEVVWSVKNTEGEASITQAGVLTGDKLGLVTVIATSKLDDSVLIEHEVEVFDDTPPVKVLEAIKFSSSSPSSVEENASITLSVNAEYKNSANNGPVAASDVEWSSSDDTIATVVDGVVNGLKAGETATITAEYDGKYATTDITVTAIVIPEVSIYVKAPAAWNTTMHYWSSKTVATVWPGEALEAADEAGWNVITFLPDAIPTAGMIINNGAKTGTIKTVDLTPPSSSGCFIVSATADGTDSDGAAAHTAAWQDLGTGDCAFGAPLLKIAATPGTKNFIADSIEVTLSVDALAEGSFYTLDGSDPASEANSARLSYSNGDKITIGDALALGESSTLKLFAAHSDSEGEDVTQSYTYTKTDVESCTPDTPSGDFKFCATTDSDAYVVTVQYTGAGDVDLTSDKTQVLLNGEYLDASEGFDATSQSWSFSASGLVPSKYSYTIRVKNDAGADATPLFVPMWIGEGMKYADFGWKDSIMYQIFNDRFLDGDPSNNLDNSIAPLNEVTDPLSQWQGGDFAGITQKIKDGYFTDMGINTLWVSSPILNSHGVQPGVNPGDDTKFASYHSYHPVATGYTHLVDYGYDKPIESAFGTADEFKELINEAHKRGIRIVPDFVTNHVQSDAQLKTDHPGWFNNEVACAGNGGANWNNEYRTTCWFTAKMPDFDFQNSPDAVKAVVDHALWIIQEFNIDGFRNDALKHMDDVFVRELKKAVDVYIETRGEFNSIAEDPTSFYMVGESLDMDWPRYHTRADMVHGQVNSSLYYAINDALFTDGKSMSDFAGSAIYEDAAYLTPQEINNGGMKVYGHSGGYSGAIMGNYFGNHDVLRALERAGGDYAKLRLAQTFLFTSPGNVPMLYQGDDIGTFQGSADKDPGNRLKMKFKEIDGLTADEEASLEHVKKVGLLREAHAPLRRGTRQTHSGQVGNDHWVYKVSYQGEDVYVALNRGDSSVSVDVPANYSDGLGNCLNGQAPAKSSCIFVKD